MKKRLNFRLALGRPFMTGHSGCEGGPYISLRYETVAEAMRAHDALAEFLRSDPGYYHPAPEALSDDALDRPERPLRTGTNR